MPRKRIKKKTGTKKRQMEKTDTLTHHLQVQEIDDLVEKIINVVNVQKKVQLAQNIIELCEALTSSRIIRNHIAKCESCQVFLNSRKMLAKLIIRGASTKG